jgi:hypothetical protein
MSSAVGTLDSSVDASARMQTAVENALQDIKIGLDSKSEMGETESLRLQQAMDRLNKMQATLSNILKSISDTSNAITNNLK